MFSIRIVSIWWGVLVLAVQTIHAQAPSFTKDVQPLLKKYCVECHRAGKIKGGLKLETHEDILKGSSKGRKAVVPGDPDKSRLVTTTEHRIKPFMPPKKSQQPGTKETELLRAGVKAGAKDDGKLNAGAADSEHLFLTSAEAHPDGPPTKDAPSYAKHIRPFFVKYCVECHNAKNDKRGLNLETYKSLGEGSDLGPVIAAGKPDESKLILSLEKKEKPHMPPKEAKRFPTKDETAQVRAWVAAGAKDDSGLIKVAVPEIKPHQRQAAPVTAVAFLNDRSLIAGCGKELLVIDGYLGAIANQYAFPERLTALAHNPKGLWLAIAWGEPGTEPKAAVAAARSISTHCGTVELSSKTHKDVVLDIALSPNEAQLATAAYDTAVKLWDRHSRSELRTLKEHSDAVYGVSFSSDGKLLASGGADRAVKVWNPDTGKLLYTLGESTDWVYTVAFSPDGKHLAAAGVDKSIRVWEVSADAHKLVHSVFGHEAPVLKLVYSKDGKTLYSLGEDRIVKAWDTSRMVERKVFDRQPETVLAMALSPDQKQLALGRYDGVVVLLNAEAGRVEREIGTPAAAQKKEQPDKQPAPRKEPAFSIKKLTPDAGPRGVPLQLTVEGDGLDRVTEATLPQLKLNVEIIEKAPNNLKLRLLALSTTTASRYSLTLKAGEASASADLIIDAFPAISEKEGNNSPGTGQAIKLPATVVGTLDRAGDVDFYRFAVKSRQQLGVQVLAKEIGSKVDPALQLFDSAGRIVAESDSGLLGYTFDKAGTYALGVRDREPR